MRILALIALFVIGLAVLMVSAASYWEMKSIGRRLDERQTSYSLPELNTLAKSSPVQIVTPAGKNAATPPPLVVKGDQPPLLIKAGRE